MLANFQAKEDAEKQKAPVAMECLACASCVREPIAENFAFDFLTCTGEGQRWKGKGQGRRDRRSGPPNL